MAANAFGASAARAVIVRDTVGSEATRPITPGSARNSARSAAQSPPIASVTARSSTIFPGSWTAISLRHGLSCSDKPLVKPDFSAVRSSSVAPACDTTPEPSPSMTNRGYGNIDSLTRKVLHNLDKFNLRKSNYRRSEHLSPFLAPIRRYHHDWPRLTPDDGSWPNAACRPSTVVGCSHGPFFCWSSSNVIFPELTVRY